MPISPPWFGIAITADTAGDGEGATTAAASRPAHHLIFMMYWYGVGVSQGTQLLHVGPRWSVAVASGSLSTATVRATVTIFRPGGDLRSRHEHHCQQHGLHLPDTGDARSANRVFRASATTGWTATARHLPTSPRHAMRAPGWHYVTAAPASASRSRQRSPPSVALPFINIFGLNSPWRHGTRALITSASNAGLNTTIPARAGGDAT